jgi:hypothetical protein
MIKESAINRPDMMDWVQERFGKEDYRKDPKVALLKVDVTGIEIKHANLDEYYTNENIPKERISIEIDNYVY